MGRPALGCLALLTALYLWLTLRGALTEADVTPHGPERQSLRQRLSLLSAMMTVCLMMVFVAPSSGSWWLMQLAIIACGLALPPRLAVSVGGGLLALAMAVGRLVSGRLEPMLLVLMAFGARGVRSGS
jgi:NAD/NADP transhydrogenase beta subunit